MLCISYKVQSLFFWKFYTYLGEKILNMAFIEFYSDERINVMTTPFKM